MTNCKIILNPTTKEPKICHAQKLSLMWEGMKEQDNAVIMLACNLCSNISRRNGTSRDMGGFEEDVQFICRACRNIFDTTAGLHEHLKRFHKISVQDDSDTLAPCRISSVFHYCGRNKF